MSRAKTLLAIGLVVLAGLVYWLWPQIQILVDVLSNRFNF